MSPEAIVIALVGAVLGILVTLTGWALNQKVSAVDKKLDALDEKVTALGEHRVRTEERLASLERWRDQQQTRRRRA